jgi:hypothetical protein
MKFDIAILGAADPEMAAIEGLLTAAGIPFAYAAVDGVRCHPGNAYKANSLVGGNAAIPQMPAYDDAGRPQCAVCAVTVECQVEYRPDLIEITHRVDHHRPGDPGYGLPPGQYWPASSLGQVCAVVGVLGDEPGEQYYDGAVRIRTFQSDFNLDDWDYVPVQDAHLVAAADHCLAAAYRGECPGVDPDELMRWRAESRAAFQGRPVADVLADIESARSKLRAAVRGPGAMDCGHGDHAEAGCPGCGPVPGPEYADLRGESIPELPEAACREDIPFLSTVTDRDGREKVVLQAAPAELVARFMAGDIVTGLTDVYGDPARGFSGGYLK